MIGLEGAVEPRECPYVGLDYYQEELGAWFFGREAEGDKIITNLQGARLTLLHAESGVGKSSLLRAGVAWRLHQVARHRPALQSGAIDIPVVFSSWQDDPIPKLTGAISKAIGPFLAGRPRPALPADRLDVAIEMAADAVDANLLLILDQFEEYFLYSAREPTPERFADQLARCIGRADLPANFLIAIREDAYAGLGDLFKGRIANVYGNYLQMEYLDRTSAEQAIRAPIEVYNGQAGITERVEIQDELVEAVLDQVRAYDVGRDAAPGPAAVNGSGSRVATPLLQLVMETIWKRERAEGSPELRLSTLQKLEGVGKIVDNHLGQALHTLGGAERQIAMDTFDHLVTPSGGKIAESVPDLAHRTGRSQEQVGRVLEKLDRARILRPIPAPPGQDPIRFRRYEIFHDVLAPTINHAIATREERRRLRTRLRFLAVLSLGILVAAMLVLLTVKSNIANTDKQIADSGQLAMYAEANVARDPELSALLALQALRRHDTTEAEAALRDALPQIQTVRTFQAGTTASAAVFDPVDANKVASAGHNGAASIWDVRTGRRLASLLRRERHAADETADAVAFNPTGTEVAVGYGLGAVVVFDAQNGNELERTNAGVPINDIRFVGSTGDLALATSRGIGLWLPQNGGYSNCCDVLSTEEASTIAVDPRNPLELAVATDSGTAIWKLRASGLSSGQPHRLDTGDDYDAEFSPDGSKVVTAGGDGNVRVYDVATSSEVMTLDADDTTAQSAEFSPDGQWMVAGFSSGNVRVWDAATGLEVTLLAGHASAVNTARFNANSSEIVTSSDDGTIRVWRAQPRELQRTFPSSYYSAPSQPEPVYAAEYSSAGDRILTVDSSEKAHVLTASGKPLAVLNPGHAVDVNSARFNRAGTAIVTADSDGTVDLWHATGPNYNPIALSTPIRVAKPAEYADFSPGGSRIVVVTDDDTAEVFSTQTGRQLLPPLNPGHDFLLSVAVFSPSGRLILTGDDNGQVEAWNAATGHEIRPLGTPGPAINDVEFNRSGSEFATTSDDGFVTIWATRGYRQLLSINACPSPRTAAFNPHGSKIVVGCGDGSTPVFNAATGQQLTVLQAFNAGTVIGSAAFSPDGKNIITAFAANGANYNTVGGVRIWSAELTTSSLPALERLAGQRVTRTLTPAERKAYLAGIGG